MPWKRIFRWLAIFALAGVVFAGAVTALWWEGEDASSDWNWENRDGVIVGRALGHKISNAHEARDFTLELISERLSVAEGQVERHSVSVDQLLPLLGHSDPKVRAATANIIGRAGRALRPEHLAPLIAAHRNGLPVLYQIARIGTPDAVEYVCAALNKPGTEQDLCRMLTAGGPTGIRRLAAIYRDNVPVSTALHRASCAEFHRLSLEESLSAETPVAVEAWLDVARDVRCTPHNRALAIEVLGLIGDASKTAVPALKELATDDSKVVAARARQAIAQIEGAGTMARYLPDLEFEITQTRTQAALYGTVFRITELGHQGRPAGPVAIRLLDAGDWGPRIFWEQRVDAVRMLGAIGYTEAAPRLIAALENEDDWVLAGAAAEALARLGSREAIPALQRMADHYWYPPVRALAAESIRVLRGETRFQEFKRPPDHFGWYRKMALDRHVWEFSGHPRSVPRVNFVARFAAVFCSNTWDRAWQWRADRIARTSGLRNRRPDCGQGFGDGYLLGYDNGEWGGLVDYVVEGKVVKEFNVARVLGFYRMPCGLIVVASEAGSQEGMLYRIRQGPDGAPVCVPFKRLPTEASAFSHPRRVPIGRCWNGDLLISGQGGDVILTRSGLLRMAD